MTGRLAGEVYAELDERLDGVDAELRRRYPGDPGRRQPVHTAYVPADRFHPRLVEEWGAAALAARRDHPPLPYADDLHERVVAKLAREPIEDLRIDFEDGYGRRDDEEEDRRCGRPRRRLVTPHAPCRARVKSGVSAGAGAHEAAVLRWLGEMVPTAAPILLADDGDGRMLLEHVPGHDWYDADAAGRAAIATDHHRTQVVAMPHADALAALGVPDRRGPALVQTVRKILAASGADLSAVEGLLRGLDERLAAVASCGLPDTLVHVDLHPGNVRVEGARRVVIDCGDSFVGHPAFDILRLTETVPVDDAAALIRTWDLRWRASVPGCDPARAVELFRPVAPLRGAAVYADFLRRIEPSERPFHAADVPQGLARAAAAALR